MVFLYRFKNILHVLMDLDISIRKSHVNKKLFKCEKIIKDKLKNYRF